MFIKIHKSYRPVVAICDSNLIGKKFEEGEFQIDVKEAFFKGDEITKEMAIQMLKKQALEDATFNIIGKESIQASVEAEIIKATEISTIAGIPFSLSLI